MVALVHDPGEASDGGDDPDRQAAGVAGAAVASGLGLGVAAPAAAAGTTFHVTSAAMCGGAGTFEQAVKDANANPGLDTIGFDTKMRDRFYRLNPRRAAGLIANQMKDLPGP